MAGRLTVRPARPHERAALEALQWRASLANEADRHTLLAHPDAIDLPLEQLEAGHTLVAEVDGTVFGFAVVLPRADGDAELDGLFVEPDRWKAGAGRALVERACALARSRRAAALHVIGNPEALAFYQRCDFVIVGSHATRFGPGVLMRRALGPA